MLIITNVDTIEIPDAECPGGSHNLRQPFVDTVSMYLRDTYDTPLASSIEVASELVRGRIFHRANGFKIMIAHTKQAQDILQLPYDAWETHFEFLERAKKASWLTRLKWVFKGLPL